MTVLDYENVFDVTTELSAVEGSRITQTNPVTRRLLHDAVTEFETRAIEGNRAFHATVVERLGVGAPTLIDADDLM